MNITSIRLTFLILLLALVLLLSCCGQPQPAEEEPSQPTVIEQGAAAREETTREEEEEENIPAEPFPDKGEETTVEDLTAALENIDSYYFEQSVAYPEGQVFMQVWYKEGRMKLVTSAYGYGLTESYYDYGQGLVVDYSPGAMTTAYGRSFDPNGDNAPTNPKMEDYSTATVLGFESVGRQTCLVLQTLSGDKLWVSTKYGFPLRVEFTDSLGERYQVDYKNLAINQVDDEDVSIPSDLPVVYN